MPLYCPNGEIFESIEQYRTKYATLTSDFYHSSIQTPTDHDRFLYIHQKEIASNIKDGIFDYIGSDDATTCHIIIARNRNNLTSLFCHIDSPLLCVDLNDHLCRLGNNLDLYVFGGIGDDLSLSITQALIATLCTVEAKCILQLFAVNDMIADPTSSTPPRFYGIGISMCQLTGTPSSSSSSSSLLRSTVVSPMSFPPTLRGPAAIFRFGMSSFQQNSKLRRVYDGSVSEHLVIDRGDPIDVDEFSLLQLLSLPDERLLKYTSTSPSLEPAHFASMMRECCKSILNPQFIPNLFSSRDQNLYRMVHINDQYSWQLRED